MGKKDRFVDFGIIVGETWPKIGASRPFHFDFAGEARVHFPTVSCTFWATGLRLHLKLHQINGITDFFLWAADDALVGTVEPAVADPQGNDGGKRNHVQICHYPPGQHDDTPYARAPFSICMSP